MLSNTGQPISVLRILAMVLVSILLFIFLYKIWDSDYVYGHRKYFSSNDVIKLDFNNLSAITVDQVKKEYRLNWWCRPDNSNPNFGDFFCADELKGWNDIPAMLVVFWFKNGRLNNAKIDVPYWHHSKLIAQIRKNYGEPIKKSHRLSYLNITKQLTLLLITKGKYYDKNEKIRIDNLGVWQLKSGAWLVTEIEQGKNPFLWCTVFWINPEDAKSEKFNEP